MTKQFKTTTLLADDNGLVWVEAQLSQAQVNRLIKGYERAGVSLTAYGSPDQVLAQVRELSTAFA